MRKICKWCRDEFENRTTDFCSIECANLELDYKLTT